MNHCDYIDKRNAVLIERINRIGDIPVSSTISPETFSDWFSTCLFTNETKKFFTGSYVKSHKCSDCEALAEQRCHGIGQERPKLVKEAFQNMVSKSDNGFVSMKDVLVEYFRLHKTTKFTFKCADCHRKERKSKS